MAYNTEKKDKDMKKTVLSMTLLVLSFSVAAAQGQFAPPQVGDQFTYKYEKFSMEGKGKTKGENGSYTLTYVGVANGAHRYEHSAPGKVLREENLEGQLVTNSSGDKFSKHAGWRPTVVDAPHKWEHEYSINTFEKRDMTCESAPAGPHQVGNTRFEKTVMVRCTDQRLGKLTPRYHEIIWATDVPVALSHRIYWEGSTPGHSLLTLIQIQRGKSPVASLSAK